jgi:glucose-6-phosphate 1-epimerase
MNLSALNQTFGIPGVVGFEPGPGGLVVARIRNDFTEATVALHGGHVMSHIPHGKPDLLWMSKHSYFEAGKPIRGGIPVCWPWFGAHPENPELPAHGFVRLQEWDVKATTILADGATRISLILPDRPEYRKFWPHPFSLEIVVTVADRLEVELVAGNTGEEPFTCTAALHSYFNAGDIAAVTVTGLDGVEYIDTVEGKNLRQVQSGSIDFKAETDRIYLDTTSPCLIHDAQLGRTLHVAKDGSRTTVVWNPWIAKSARMPDFGNEEYRGMLCVETANARDDKITIAPGKSHSLKCGVRSAECERRCF